MKYLLLEILAISLFASFGYAQDDLKKVKRSVGLGKEVYTVLKNDTTIRQGCYEYKYGDEIFVKGLYENGCKNGNWHYGNSKDFKINAFYLNDKKDSVWSYIEDGVLISSIRFKDGKRDGIATGYYLNGVINSLVPFREGRIDGTKKIFYHNGNLKYEVDFKNGGMDGNLKHYDSTGNVTFHLVYTNDKPFSIEKLDIADTSCFSGNLKNGTGYIRIFEKSEDSDSFFVKSEQEYVNGKLNGKNVEYSNNGKIQYTGYFKNDFMVGQWNFYNPSNPRFHSVKVYALRDSVITDSTDLYHVKPACFSAYTITLPRFQGKTIDKFRDYIGKCLVYPEVSQENGITGRVNTRFTIDITGKVGAVRVLKNGDKNLDNEAKRVLELSPNWIPGFEEGIPALVFFTMPITFMLQ